MLKLLFYNMTSPASIEVIGEAFMLTVDTIVRDPSGETVAKYAHGEWWVEDLSFLRIECAGSVICRFGTREQSGARHGPYRRIQLIDGVLVADQAPVAALHPGRGWVAEPHAQVWTCVCLEPPRPIK